MTRSNNDDCNNGCIEIVENFIANTLKTIFDLLIYMDLSLNKLNGFYFYFDSDEISLRNIDPIRNFKCRQMTTIMKAHRKKCEKMY